MRTTLNRTWLGISLLAAVTTIGLPAAAATTSRTEAQPIRQAPVSAYNRRSAAVMAQFGADSTALSAQDLTMPLIARLDAPSFPGMSFVIAPVSEPGSVVQAAAAAPTQPESSIFDSRRLPHSSPWAAMFATMMLVAFFLFRRTQ